jgi:cobalamin biosynthesis Co2+ chelatase CbiK
LINKLVKSGENNDLDSQKKILTKLHKNGFNDVTISALYFSTLNICFFKKEFSENAAFIKKIPYSVKDTIAAKNKFDKTNPNVPNPFEEKLQLAALKEDKME